MNAKEARALLEKAPAAKEKPLTKEILRQIGISVRNKRSYLMYIGHIPPPVKAKLKEEGYTFGEPTEWMGEDYNPIFW